MKVQSQSDRLQSHVISLQGEDWLNKQRIAGSYLAEIMTFLIDFIRNKTDMSLLDYDAFVESEILKRNCTPTFKGYHGFPNATCISVNKQLVHGIPSNYKLKDGDIITFDFGVTYEGAIADSATTLIYGESINKMSLKLIETTRDCLYNAIRAIRVGKRLGVVGNAIYKTARNAGFNIIDKYGGHGISWHQPHADVFVANKSTPEEGVVMQPGLTIAIEPLLVPGNSSTNTKLADDGWTVYTEDVSAHWEHSLYLHKDHVEIVSHRSDEEQFIPKKVYYQS
jgi:methionyl aminopeptidase